MNCTDQISSDAETVSYPPNVSIYPGEMLRLSLNVTDNLGHNVLNQTTFLGTFFNTNTSLNVSTNLIYITNGYISISGSGSGSTTLSMEGVGNGQLNVNMPIEVIQCPPGLVNSDSTCTCDPTGDYGSTVLCLGPQTTAQNNMPTALLQRGHWMGFISSLDYDAVVGDCPPGYCDGVNSSYLLGRYIRLPRSLGDLDDIICSGNRTGVLCGSCKSGYAPAINSDQYQCVQCNLSDATMSILKYIGTEYVPLSAFFLVIILCNVRITTGPANAFIVFSQVISSTFDINTGINASQAAYKFTKAYTFIYGIFNLDFISNLLSPYCISERLDTLGVVSLSYVLALYPLVMICLVIMAFKVKSIAGCCKSKRCHISISPMMAITCFLLLSYNKLILTAALILSEGKLRNSSGTNVDSRLVYIQGTHSSDEAVYRVRYASVAAIVLCVTSILPIMLLGYPVALLERCLKFWPIVNKQYPADKVNIFLDCFQGSFENNRRYFASLYFMFRLAIAIIYILPLSETSELILQQMICMIFSLLVAILQPYKERLTNFWDCFVFLDLAFLSGLSLYALENELPILLVSIQIILVMLPLVCMVVYWVWNGVPFSAKKHIKMYCTNIIPCNKGTSKKYQPHIPSYMYDEEDVLIDRSQEVNSYTVITSDKD